MTPESRLKNNIMVSCGSRGWVCFHINVGSVRLPDGSFFSTGVPEGWPDLLILTNDGRAMFVETKIKPRRASDEQLKMIARLRSLGFKADVIYSIEQFERFATS